METFDEKKPHELYMENIRLRASQDNLSDIDEEDGQFEKVFESERFSFLKKFRPRACLTSFLIIVISITLMLVVTMAFLPKVVSKMTNEISIRSDPLTIGRVDRSDVELCQYNQMKRSFPDFDYATYGYNIMSGYPLAVGHDPGLTRPVFDADYSESRQTADCRYQVPKGFNLAPDVSCVTSFTSDVVKDSQQFSKQLSFSASASGGGWGASFSASSEYKKKTSQMAASEAVFIFSRAVCNYYFSKLNMISPPSLHPDFVRYVKTIKSEKDVMSFFDYYGTHFQTYTLFGARFIYEHKMSQKSFQEQSSQSLSVSVQASYSGLFSLSGGFGMSQESSQAASNFQKKVETKTISIGAPPPANGNTLTWASTVKQTPIPVEYQLENIEKLFTERFMKNTGVEYDRIGKMVAKAKSKYCEALKAKGKVDDCSSYQTEVHIDFLRMTGGSYYRYSNIEQCKRKCEQDNLCFAMRHHSYASSCFVYRKRHSNHTYSSDRHNGVKTIIYPDIINLLSMSLKIEDVAVKSHIKNKGSRIAKSEEKCYQLCAEDPLCSLFTYKAKSTVKEINCWLYNIGELYCKSDYSNLNCKAVGKRFNHNVVFLPKRESI